MNCKKFLISRVISIVPQTVNILELISVAFDFFEFAKELQVFCYNNSLKIFDILTTFKLAVFSMFQPVLRF